MANIDESKIVHRNLLYVGVQLMIKGAREGMEKNGASLPCCLNSSTVAAVSSLSNYLIGFFSSSSIQPKYSFYSSPLDCVQVNDLFKLP